MILVVQNEVITCQMLTIQLSMMGYSVCTATDGEEALEIYRRENLSLVILDIILPKLDGYAVCKFIRCGSDIPIIILTALGDITDKITGFDLGVDDYMTKPFLFREFEVRVRVALKRFTKLAPILNSFSSNFLFFGSLRIDLNKRQVYKKNEKVRLTGMEFSLLELLISNSGQAFSRASILEEVWGYRPERHVDTRVVDVHVSRLRSKLEVDPSNPDLILTARGIGYLFQKTGKS
nr:regulatory component of sensory transduction [Cryptomonas sp. NIES-345]